WDGWKKKQAAARSERRWVGRGIGSTLDSGTNNFGQARIINPDAPFSGQSKVGIVKLDIYGEVVVSMGSVPQGQGHETAAAQVVADALGITPDLVNVRPGFDTAHNAYTGHTGTYASQFAVTGLTAIHGAAMKLRKELSRLAAWKLEAKEKDLEFGIGAALLENCAYDSDGNLLTATFSDYTPITAMNMPELLYAHMESPSPFTLNGAKGMGEGGAAPVHTICAALQDALYPSGVIIDDSHNTGDSLFH